MNITFAGTSTGIVQCQGTSCTWQDFANTLANLLSTLVRFSFWIAVLLSVIGAFLMMFHGPRPDLHKKGWDMIKIAILGYISILLAGILFDAILEFFTPEFRTFRLSNFSLAAELELNPRTYFNPLKNQLTSGLRCGQSATNAVDKLISCIGEGIGALTGLAVILLGVAIFASAAYLISTPFFGLGNIPKAWQILIWSTIGLVIVLLANIIADQVKNLLQPSPRTPFYPNFVLAGIKPGEVQFENVTKTVRVCPPTIFGSNNPCEYPDIESIIRRIVDFIVQRLAPPLLVFLIIIGGFFYLLSPFDVKNIQTGHKYIQWAIYGYVVLLVVTAILSVISVFFGGPSINP